MEFISDNINIRDNELTFAGRKVSELAGMYGTPLYLMDENKIRENCRAYTETLKKVFGNSAMAVFASKACSFKQIYRIVNDENMGCDVVSSGEIYTAVSAGFDMGKAYFHSNNKTESDINYALDCGVGHIVVDNYSELHLLSKIASARGVKQKILLRLTPGIDPHTYEEVSTGKIDSKFGQSIDTGDAEKIVKEAASLPGIVFDGIHCHVGSQVFDHTVMTAAAEKMLKFVKQIKDDLGVEVNILDLGGGIGVRYVYSDPVINKRNVIEIIGNNIKKQAETLGIKLPFIVLEPGRSIVADAGLTVYTAGNVKEIKGYKNYVSVDGGMTDNPRYALYKSDYTVLPVKNISSPLTFKADLVGRCCESGDVLQKDVLFPADIKAGDYLCVLTTGAYNYSMASNYNRIPRPPVVIIKDEKDYIAVKRETNEDIARLDV